MATITQGFSDAGQAKVVALLLANATAKHVGWGSGTTAFAVTQATLVAANPEARTSGVISNPAADTHRVVASINATAPRTVAEAALFDAATGGNMLARATHTSRSLVAGDRIRYTIDTRFTDSAE